MIYILNKIYNMERLEGINFIKDKFIDIIFNGLPYRTKDYK